MNIKAVFLLVMLLISGFTKAQFTAHRLLHAGYVYQNQSFGELGGRMLFLENDDVLYRVGLAGMFGSVNGNFAFLPKIQGDILLNFGRNVDLYHSFYFLAGAEATTKYIAPKAGVTMFGLVDLTGGYAFPFDNRGIHGKEMKGLNINITLNVPIVLIHAMLH